MTGAVAASRPAHRATPDAGWAAADAGLPDELWLEIFAAVPPTDLHHAAGVCRHWHRLAYDEALQRRAFAPRLRASVESMAAWYAATLHDSGMPLQWQRSINVAPVVDWPALTPVRLQRRVAQLRRTMPETQTAPWMQLDGQAHQARRHIQRCVRSAQRAQAWTRSIWGPLIQLDLLGLAAGVVLLQQGLNAHSAVVVTLGLAIGSYSVAFVPSMVLMWLVYNAIGLCAEECALRDLKHLQKALCTRLATITPLLKPVF